LVVQLTLQQVVEVVVQEPLVQLHLLQMDNLGDQVVVDRTKRLDLEEMELHVKVMMVVMDQVSEEMHLLVVEVVLQLLVVTHLVVMQVELVELEKYLEQQDALMLVEAVEQDLLQPLELVEPVVVEQDLLETVELKQQQELQTLAVVVAVEQEQIVVVEIMVDQEL
tara:strand:- start:50 stop:547 length:498 start_codon:yes stop_codon:yes gene_type:complete